MFTCFIFLGDGAASLEEFGCSIKFTAPYSISSDEGEEGMSSEEEEEDESHSSRDFDLRYTADQPSHGNDMSQEPKKPDFDTGKIHLFLCHQVVGQTKRTSLWGGQKKPSSHICCLLCIVQALLLTLV